MRKPRTALLDAGTAIFLLLTVGMIGYTLLLIADPRSSLNPLRRPTSIAQFVIATDLPTNTPTATPTPGPATATATATSTRTLTSTATATHTPTITNTPVLAVPTQSGATSAPPTASGAQYYTAKPIAYRPNGTSDGCKWSSVAGTVLDRNGTPVAGIAVRIVGGGGTIDETHYSGQEPRFGPGGFEAFLGTQPREDDYTVQLLGKTGSPLSDAVPVHTKTGCQQNVAFVSFQQSK